MNNLEIQHGLFETSEFLNIKHTINIIMDARHYGEWDSEFYCETDLTPYGLGDLVLIRIQVTLSGSTWVHTITIVGEDDSVIFDDTVNNEDINDLGSCEFLQWFITGSSYINDLMYLRRHNVYEEDDVNSNTDLDLYLLNDEKDHIDKELIYCGTISGDFNDDVNVMSLTLIIKDYASLEEFNYIYVNELHRYYYVDEIIYISSELTQLNLSEDVLMSHRDLIKSQAVYISRSENYGDNDKIDNEVSTDYNKVITEEVLTPTNSIYSDTGCFIISVVNDEVVV